MTLIVENVDLDYKGKKVKGEKLTISSDLGMCIDKIWDEVQKSSLLEFICKGRIKFNMESQN